MSSSLRGSQLPPRRRPTVRPGLETFEDRIVPAAAIENPLATATVASPPATPSVTAVVSHVESTLGQAMTAVQQEARSDLRFIAQEFAQVESYLIRQMTQFFGISPNPNPALNPVTPQTGSGTSSAEVGSSNSPAGANPGNHPPHGGVKIEPDTGGGGGGWGGGNTATVSGQVWLDNNGDGSLDNGEMGFSGITVNLMSTATGEQAGTATTDANGNFSFTITPLPAPENTYQIQVIMPPGDLPTYQGADSDIDGEGDSPVFNLIPGGVFNIIAGILSMQVTTVQDDAKGAIQNQITLRDAMQTGNNGPPPLLPGVTFSFKQGQGGPTISLQAALPDIAKSYNITGPGDSTLAVQGNGNAANPYRIFTINAGVTTTISGLTIKGGFDGTGAGGAILNQGKLKLTGDTITGNQTNVSGGGLYNQGGTATLSNVNLVGNSALTGSGGGIYVNGGSLTLNHVVISRGGAVSATKGYGGGMYIYAGKVTVSAGTIQENTAGVKGGGIYLNAGALTLKGAVQIGNSNTVTNQGGGQGGGMYLANNSITTFNGCTITGNSLNNAPPIQNNQMGIGAYQQNFATLNNVGPGLLDLDDPGGVPWKGP